VHLATKLVRTKMGKATQGKSAGEKTSHEKLQEKEIPENPLANAEGIPESPLANTNGTPEGPLAKAEGIPESTFDKAQAQTKPRKYISIKTRRILMEKAHHCCEYIHPQTGTRCGDKYQLQVEHIKPIAFGGDNELENLKILCRTHNLQAAVNMGLRLQ
jgi:hypothetical protein